MFGKKHLLDEIKFLREENRELRLQLIAMSNKSGQYFNTKMAAQRKEGEVKNGLTVVSEIENAPAKTEAEKAQKKQAVRHAQRIFAGK